MDNLFKKKDKRTPLEKKYDEALRLLDTYTPGSDAYNKQFEICERMHAMIVADREQERHISPDGLLNMGLGISQVLLIVNKEWIGNVTSRALSLVKKAR